MSRGTPAGSQYCAGGAWFVRDGKGFYGEYCARGYNVAVIDPATGTVVNSGVNFDTYFDVFNDYAESAKLAAFLSAISPGHMVLIAIGDTIGAKHPAVIREIESLGSRMVRDVGFRNAWALIAIKGNGPALAEGLSSQPVDPYVRLEVQR